MQLETTRFGAIEIEDSAVITLTQPIIGFEENRRFVILPGPEGSPVQWLQSTDRGDLAFLIMDPRAVVPDYHVDLNSHDLAELAASGVEELNVYTLVVVPQDKTQVRTNLRAPLIINPKQRLGKQTILERSDYPIQFFLARDRQAPEASEVAHARSDA